MKIEIEIGLDDLLEEVEDEESGNTYYEFKDKISLQKDIEERIKTDVVNRVSVNSWSNINNAIINIVNENKEEIINKAIEMVAKKIINTKAIKDFKKTLEE